VRRSPSLLEADKTGYAGTSHGANEIAPVAGTRADGDDVQDRGVAYGKPRGVARTCPDWPMAPGAPTSEALR
jgi:hypothetical protein